MTVSCTPRDGRRAYPAARRGNALAGVSAATSGGAGICIKIVWPADAPTSGTLESKRATSDRATTAVYREFVANGGAPTSLVADARQKLRDYGQPALQYVRDHAPTAVSDGFHRFLLSLYDSLEQAALTKAPTP